MSSVTSIVTTTVTVTASSSSASADRAPAQAGVLEGANPTTYNPSNPIILFIIQAGIIIIFCRLLHWPLSKLKQPRVIAEVIGGILLGPSVMMRIPGFQETIFPTASMPSLSVVANLGLILFLFLVALEVDIRLLMSNWRVAVSVGLASMILPFGLGCALAWGLYNQFRNDPGLVPIDFPIYMLFIGTALAITAFPVLCRILTDLRLLQTPVGVTVLAAGVGNDVTGWILLALCVVLVNNQSGLTALWVLLCCVAWTLFLFYAIRPVLMILLRRTNSLKNGPTQSMVALVLLLALVSAWFTGIIGVHPIFGAFLMGLICPHEGGFTIKLTEKIEDLVTVLFLPLYFALSGLSTNLGLLDNGITWGYVVAIITIAFAGKIIGGTLAARFNNLVWRESFTIGVLMSCKGLVELIVLNVGLQAHILSQRTFTMFVVMALVTTVATTPLTELLYPMSYRKKLEAWKKGEIDWDGNPLHANGSAGDEKQQLDRFHRLLIHLRLDSFPSMFTLITLLAGDTKHFEASSKSKEATTGSEKQQPLEAHGLRVLELTERTSSVMKVAESEELASYDPVVNTFRSFAQLYHVAVSGSVSVVPEDSYAETIVHKASDVSSDLVIIPWSETGSVTEEASLPESISASHVRLSCEVQNTFVEQIMAQTTCDTAVFVARGFGGAGINDSHLIRTRTAGGLSIRSRHGNPGPSISDHRHHIFFPFFGGKDDRAALRLVLQLVQNEGVTATIAHFIEKVESEHIILKGKDSTGTGQVVVASSAGEDSQFLRHALNAVAEAAADRVTLSEVALSVPRLTSCLEMAQQEISKSQNNAGDLVVVGLNKGLFQDNVVGTSDVNKTLGHIADGLLAKGIKASVMVIQAAP